MSSNDSQHIIEKRGPTSQAARARGEVRATAVLCACLAQFMFLFAQGKLHSVKINKISTKLNGLLIAFTFFEK